MKKVFFDTEFTSLSQDAELISIGLVSENERFYAEIDSEFQNSSPWVKEHVLPYRILKSEERISKEKLAKELQIWFTSIAKGGKLEMWADVLAYDWVLFQNIFGDAFRMPAEIYYIPFDISTLLKVKGIDSDINREDFLQHTKLDAKHNALYDAKIAQKCYQKLMSM